MGDIGVDIFLERLKELITTSKLDLITNENQQLVSLEEDIKYLRGFLKVTEKKRNEHSEMGKLVKKIRDVVSEAEDIVELFVIDAFEADASCSLPQGRTRGGERFAADGSYSLPLRRTRGGERVVVGRRNPLVKLHLTLELLKKSHKLVELFNSAPTTARRELFNDQDSLSLDLEGVEKENDQDSLSLDLEGVEKENDQDSLSLDLEGVEKENDQDSLSLDLEGVEKENDQDSLSLDLEGVKKDIKTLMAEVKKIYEENMYDINGEAVKKLMKHSSTGIGSGGGLRSSGGSNTSKEVKDQVVVGFEEEVERLLEKLDDYKGGGLEIVTIIGAGGGGKTTLARKVYDHPFTSYNFEVRAWVDVSQDYDKTMKRDLLISILKSATPEKHEDYGKMSEDELGEKVLKCLKCKRYLIVMDDIWDIEAWNDIRRSFPNECKGSKVLFTSRLDMDKVVQRDSVHSIPHRLAPLPHSSSWELLQKKVFGGEPCPQELEEIGEQIAGKCGGLPLAIVAIAGILATEDKTLKLWKEVAERLSLIIEKKNQEGCMEVLELSYNHLPLHLKACFLYIGAFPEDCEIPIRELIWSWIAEGFIQQSEGGKSLEDVAKDYLIDLIDRSLVMVARKRALGEIKACRVHDLLRVLCSKKAEEDNFFVQIYGVDSFSACATSKHRRLFIGCESFYKYQSFYKYSRPQDRNLHSIVCHGVPTLNYLQKLSSVLENFKLLKVLNIVSTQSVGLIKKKKSVGEIKIGHPLPLRYLAFKFPDGLYNYSFIDRLCFPYDGPRQHPNFFFSNLLNLETLNVQASGKIFGEIPLPCNIFKMVKLRHLYSDRGVFNLHEFSNLSYEERAKICFDHSSKLDSLQTLHKICACNNCRSILERTPNLRKLGFVGELISHADVLMLPDVEFLKCLDTLSFEFTRSSARRRGSRRHSASTRRVRVHVPKTFPAGLKFPPSVTRLTLKQTLLKWEELSLLQTLPSLEVLKLLDNACCGPVWDTSVLEEGFPQLKYLRLNFLDIEKWEASEVQFPLLEVLVVVECPKLEQIPMDFANLTELRKLELLWSSRSAEESARKIQEERKNKNGDDDCLNLLFVDNDFGFYN